MDAKKLKRSKVIGAGSIVKIDGDSQVIVEAKAIRPARARIKVGGVSITSDKASPAQVKRAVETSGQMLERLSQKIIRPGVQLKAGRNTPLFFTDPKHPDRFLRKLNGKIEQGVLENGAFKVTG